MSPLMVSVSTFCGRIVGLVCPNHCTCSIYGSVSCGVSIALIGVGGISDLWPSKTFIFKEVNTLGSSTFNWVYDKPQ